MYCVCLSVWEAVSWKRITTGCLDASTLFLLEAIRFKHLCFRDRSSVARLERIVVVKRWPNGSIVLNFEHALFSLSIFSSDSTAIVF